MNMISIGTVTLPNGCTISSGQGGTYSIGTDTYPITIVGWSKSGKTIFYRSARSVATKDSNFYGVRGEQCHQFIEDPNAIIEVATWRRPGTKQQGNTGCFRPKGSTYSRIETDGYGAYRDPHF